MLYNKKRDGIRREAPILLYNKKRDGTRREAPLCKKRDGVERGRDSGKGRKHRMVCLGAAFCYNETGTQ